jgi:hypothetical protein
MVKLFFTLLFFFTIVCAKAQNVGIGTTNPKASAALEVTSNNKGLLIPRTSATSRTGIAAPAKGLMVYDTTHSAFFYYDGGTWRPFYEKNYDSATVDHYNVNGASVNLPSSSVGGFVITTGNSGFIYDNGGPAGNYSANNFSNASIVFDDSTFQIKITVEEMNAEIFYDSLFILQQNGTLYTDTIATFTGTQTGTVIANKSVRIYFKTNNINQFAGFKIRWGRLRNSGVLQTLAPLYGWHFNNAKMAAMGGLQKKNNWHTDSVGFGSLSYGIGNKAKGKHSFAVGYNSAALGDYSTSMGNGTDASGSSSTAMGSGTTASGSSSSAMGATTTAIGDFSTAMGYNTDANGDYSTAMGYNTDANGDFSTAMGNSTNAIGDYSTAMGLYSDANGDYSTAMGYSTNAIGDYSTAMGLYSDAKGNSSTAMGFNTTANGGASTVMGNYTIANGYSSLAIGMFNDSLITAQTLINTTTPLFIIGNGNSTIDRSNALVVLKNGNVAIGDNGSPVNRLHITGGTSASLSDNSGYITTGDVNATNMVIDNNEIQVRINGAATDLYLQESGGNISIGSVGIPSYQLELSGTAGKPGGGSWTNSSDMRLKQNIQPYNDGLSALLKIKPVWYNYNQLSGFDVTKKYVGVLAQELKEVSPYMVAESTAKKAADGSSYLSVDNSAMTYMLINAVKEQQQQIELLKAEIELLKKANK